MVRQFWGRTLWRCDRWIWGGALLFLAAVKMFAGQQPLALLLLGIACMCFLSAWRRSTIPLFTITDDELLIGTRLSGNKRLLWRAIKEVQEDGYGVRLVGRELFGGAPLNLTNLPKAQRDEFMQLVRAKVEAANTASEANG